MAKSFTLDREGNGYLTRTRGERSASERINQLLKRAMLQEQYDKLESEAEAFFASAEDKDKDSDRKEARALHSASIRSITKD
jgi:hypothetical protein